MRNTTAIMALATSALAMKVNLNNQQPPQFPGDFGFPTQWNVIESLYNHVDNLRAGLDDEINRLKDSNVDLKAHVSDLEDEVVLLDGQVEHLEGQ